jgi:hypothetical protein
MRAAVQRRLACEGGYCMTVQLSPAFHAEIILELYREFGCYQTVSQRAGVLLHAASPEQLEEIGRHLPKDLLRVLPQRNLTNLYVR